MNNEPFKLGLFLLFFLFFAASSFAQKEVRFRTNGKSFDHLPRSKDDLQRNSCTQQSYRTIDGTCNNTSTASRSEWGAADIEVARQMPAQYGSPDNFNDMGGQNRPSPRAISNAVFSQTGDIPSAVGLSSLVFSWGQFLDHDLSISPENEAESAPIVLPANEPDFTANIPFHRSEVHSGTGVNRPREQTNLITSWIDASNVYGSDNQRANWLRTFSRGKLKTSSGNLLPYNTTNGQLSGAIDSNAPSMAGDENGTQRVFVAGDVRANEQPGLTSLHTLFVREHNRICDELIANGMTNDEAIYQTARKMVGALMQQITYTEFLPALGVSVSVNSTYQANVKPDIYNIFSTAAYRIGHTMVTNEILLVDDNCDAVAGGSISLIQGFFNPQVVQNFGIDPILNGLSTQVQQEIDAFVIDNLRNFLFAPPGTPGAFGIDLASLNIQRGRDHGLPDYNTIRAHFLGSTVSNWGQITNHAPTRNALQNIYGNINNIDAWVGLLSESHMAGASVGPTMNAILVDQFTRLRDGDFYFFTRDPHLASDVLQEVRSTSLADVIRRNTNLQGFSNDAFRATSCNARVACVLENATSSNFVCDANGTPDNPTDDLFRFTVNVAGTGNGWNSVGVQAAFNQNVELGPFFISEGNRTIEIRANDCNESITLEVEPPMACSMATPCNAYATIVENNCCSSCSQGNLKVQTDFISVGNTPTNVALHKRTTISSNILDGNSLGIYSVDGDMSTTLTSTQQSNPWWEVDLNGNYDLSQIVLSGTNSGTYRILVSNRPFNSFDLATASSQASQVYTSNGGTTSLNGAGRFVRVYLEGRGVLKLSDVRIMGVDNANSDPYRYSWSAPNIGNTPYAQCLPSGIYRVTVTDAATGCSTEASFVVN